MLQEQIIFKVTAICIIILAIVFIFEKIYNKICLAIRYKQNRREILEYRLKELETRLDNFSETVGKMNWELSEIKEKENGKNNRKRSIK